MLMELPTLVLNAHIIPYFAFVFIFVILIIMLHVPCVDRVKGPTMVKILATYSNDDHIKFDIEILNMEYKYIDQLIRIEMRDHYRDLGQLFYVFSYL